jgi:peptide deformylase
MITLPCRNFVDVSNDILGTALEPVSEKKLGSKWFRHKVKEAVGTLQDAIYKPSSSAVAIAANQIGIPARFFVMLTMITEDDGMTDEQRERKRKKGLDVPDPKRQLGIVVIINPELINVRGVLEEDWEGCLSYPGQQFLIERYPIIKVRYVNNQGETVEEELQGLDARIFQHEMDHLDGIRPPDKASKVRETPSFDTTELVAALTAEEENESE